MLIDLAKLIPEIRNILRSHKSQHSAISVHLALLWIPAPLLSMI